MKTTKQRKKEIHSHKFRTQFHSIERVNFIRELPCEVTGRTGFWSGSLNAHTKGGGMGRRSTYRSIVPLCHVVHTDFDEMPNKKFLEKYNRTKASVRARAPYYHDLWVKHKGEAA